MDMFAGVDHTHLDRPNCLFAGRDMTAALRWPIGGRHRCYRPYVWALVVWPVRDFGMSDDHITFTQPLPPSVEPHAASSGCCAPRGRPVGIRPPSTVPRRRQPNQVHCAFQRGQHPPVLHLAGAGPPARFPAMKIGSVSWAGGRGLRKKANAGSCASLSKGKCEWPCVLSEIYGLLSITWVVGALTRSACAAARLLRHSAVFGWSGPSTRSQAARVVSYRGMASVSRPADR
jgi:hypothetical protein